MKQIFDWLREQIKARGDKSSINTCCQVELWNALYLINEAEAKWEADCCEWKMSRTRLKKFEEYMWITSCNNGNEVFGIPYWIVKNYNVCPYCGKPIKISEVE